MIPINVTDIESTITKHFQDKIYELNERAIKRLKKLLVDKGTLHLTKKEITFVKKLLAKISLKNVITLSVSEIDTLVKELKQVPRRNWIRQHILFPSSYKPLTCHIQQKLEYSIRRSDFYPKYFQKIGIKACVYCNAQLTVSVDTINNKNENQVEAKFQVDHIYDKNKYPYLSISLFNLAPTCATCNNIKSDNPIFFKLYTSDKKESLESKYKFELLPGTVAKYIVNRNVNDIEFKFIDPYKGSIKEYVPGTIQDTFDIQGIYDTQKDLIEELILKSQIYTRSYKESLKTIFPSLLNDDSLSNRIFVGNYTDPKDIHKRPMAKFTQDIARQLDLID